MKRKHWLFSFLLLLFTDALIKFLAFRFIPKMTWFHTVYPFGGIGIFKDFYGISFSLNHVENAGAALGMFSEYSGMLFVLRCFVIFGLFLYAVFWNRDPLRRIPFLFILAGASGNVLDYFIYGLVIDIFHFNFWGYTFPVFNFADMLISSGIIILLSISIFEKRRKPTLEGV